MECKTKAKVILFATLLITFTVGWGQARTESLAPSFDVVSIKPSVASDDTPSGLSTLNGRLSARYVTLGRCIMGAYNLGIHQLVGGPEWINVDRFDIEARTDEHVVKDEDFMRMLRPMLFDRFSLRVHYETRILPVYILTAAPKEHKLDEAPIPTIKSNTTSAHSEVRIESSGINMDQLAVLLSRRLDRQVLNQTNLPGTFNIHLHWTPENHMMDTDHDTISIFTALKEQLGLHLGTGKAPLSILIVDAASKPSAN